MNRSLFRWLTQLQRSDGQVTEVDFASYWDPAREGAPELVASSSAAMATASEPRDVHGNPRFTFAGLTAVLQPTVAT